MLVRHPRFHLSRALALTVVSAVLLTAGGCASGPSDFVKMVSFSGGKPKGPVIRSAQQQTALAASLNADRRQQAADVVLDPGASSTLALTVIRQQQSEEAKALLAESGVAIDPTAPVPSCIDPAGGPAACPSPVAP